MSSSKKPKKKGSLPSRSSTKGKSSIKEKFINTLPRVADEIENLEEQLARFQVEQNLKQKEIDQRQFEDFKSKRTQELELHKKLCIKKRLEYQEIFTQIVENFIDVAVYLIHRGSTTSTFIPRSITSYQNLKLKFKQNCLEISDTYPSCGQKVIDHILNQKISTHYEYYHWHIKQLLLFSNDLLKIAPNGYCSLKAFIFYLQDILCCSKLDGEGLRAPPKWTELGMKEVKALVEEAAQGKSHINWRTFVISVSGLRFPKIHELLELQKKFKALSASLDRKIISRRCFNRCELWFESDLRQDIDDAETLYWITFWYKSLFFKMYQISPSNLNYLELLIDLCKTYDVKESFIRIISIVNEKQFILFEYNSQRYQVYLRDKRRIFKKFTEDILRIVMRKMVKIFEVKEIEKSFIGMNSESSMVSIGESFVKINVQKEKSFIRIKSCTQLFTNMSPDEREEEVKFWKNGDLYIFKQDLNSFLRTFNGKNQEKGIWNIVFEEIFNEVKNHQNDSKDELPDSRKNCLIFHRLFKNLKFQQFLKENQAEFSSKNYRKMCFKIINS